MKKTLFVMLAFLPAIVHGQASVSTDAGRSKENSQSSSIKRDKSLSQDKAAGNRETEADSRDLTHEKSRSKSLQAKAANSEETSKSFTRDININGLLMRGFVNRYETSKEGMLMPGSYFSDCQALSGRIKNYPVANWVKNRPDGLNATYALQPGRLVSNSFQNAMPVDKDDRYISRYAQCLITASLWVAEAGEKVGRLKLTSEDQVIEMVDHIFSEMDLFGQSFIRLRQQARDIWQEATCSQWLGSADHFKAPAIQCGIFSFEGDRISVQYRETLSEAAIDGKIYKISLVAQSNESQSVEASASADVKLSASVSQSETQEKFKEAKKTATLNKSKSMEVSTTSKVDRASGNKINASPTN